MRLTIRLTEDEAAVMDAACRTHRCTRSEYVRRALDAYARDDGVLGPRLDALDARLARLEQQWRAGAVALTASGTPETPDEDQALVQKSLEALLGAGWTT
ncbi:MAG: ribbon-helix-helix protein, CopG family [Clostridia bacterium]